MENYRKLLHCTKCHTGKIALRTREMIKQVYSRNDVEDNFTVNRTLGSFSGYPNLSPLSDLI